MYRIFVLGMLMYTCLQLHAQDTLVMPLTGNGGVYNTCYAVIYDNGLDSNYKNFTHSTLTIAPLWVQSLSLYVEEFNTEIHFDSLNIYDGPATTFPLIGTYSGNTLQGQTISSSGSAVTLEFRTDDVQTGTGFKIWVSCLMGNEELALEEWKLYPNPVGNFLQIETTGTTIINKLTIVDGQGRSLQTWSTLTQLDVSFLAPGFYGLVVELANGKMVYKKWIKE